MRKMEQLPLPQFADPEWIAEEMMRDAESKGAKFKDRWMHKNWLVNRIKEGNEDKIVCIIKEGHFKYVR